MTAIGRRRILRFVGILVALIAILGWPYSFVGRGYCSLVCKAVNSLLLDSTDSPRFAQLVPDERPGFEWEAIAALRKQATKSVDSQFNIEVHHLFYLPTVVFVALTVAGKIAWGEKRVVAKLLVGILLLHLRGSLPFAFLERVATDVVHDGWVDRMLVLANESLLGPLGMTFAIPLLLWFCFFHAALVRPRQTSVA